MTYVKTYLSTLKTHVVNLKRDAKGLSRDLLRLEVRGKLGSKTLFSQNNLDIWLQGSLWQRSEKRRCIKLFVPVHHVRLFKRMRNSRLDGGA